jgi:hypothetical protein
VFQAREFERAKISCVGMVNVYYRVMKKLLICLALAALAINLQAVENAACADKAKAGCPEKAKAACAEKAQANCAEKAKACSEKKSCCTQSQAVLSPKAAEQAGK